MRDVRTAAATFALAYVAIGRPARAADVPGSGPVPAEGDAKIGVAYDAPSQCPDVSVFIERVRARTWHGDLAPARDVARFTVIVSSADGASSARVEFSGADRQPVTRTVSGRTCDEVVSAAALITALAIEATRDGAPPAPAESPEPVPAPSARDAVASPGQPPSSWVRGWGLGATGGVDSWTPAGGYVLGVFGEIAARSPLEIARLTLRGALGATSVDSRSASFTSLMARLSLCPFSLRISEPISLIPCAALDVGRLGGRGEASADLRTPLAAAILWASAEAVFLARWQITRLIAIEAGGELGFPLVRHTFVFEGPTRVVYEIPAVGAGAFAAVALLFH